MYTALYVGSVAVMLLLGVAIVGAVARDRLTKKGLEELTKRLADEEVLASTVATFQGRASHGAQQVTGPGALVLTARQLVFEMFMPQRKLSVSLHSITNAGRAKKLDPKVPALAIYFHDERADIDDVAIWLVDNAERWATQVCEARLRATKGDDPRPPEEVWSAREAGE